MQRKHTGRFSKSLPSHFSRSTAAGIPGSVACRASIRFFAAPCAQCQEVSRPEFTLTHSIRSFVRTGKKRLDRGQSWFCRDFHTVALVRRFASRFYGHCALVLPTTRTGEFWHDIIVFRLKKNLAKYNIIQSFFTTEKLQQH